MSKGISFQCFGAATEKGAVAEYPGPAITRVGVLWRTGYITIDAILIQWDAHKWRGILQFSLHFTCFGQCKTKNVICRVLTTKCKKGKIQTKDFLCIMPFPCLHCKKQTWGTRSTNPVKLQYRQWFQHQIHWNTSPLYPTLSPTPVCCVVFYSQPQHC